MNIEFLDKLGVTEEQRDVILRVHKDELFDAELKAEGAHSALAARVVLDEDGIDILDTDAAISHLKENHAYLFSKDEPVFTGPAGGDKGTDDVALRRALGI